MLVYGTDFRGLHLETLSYSPDRIPNPQSCEARNAISKPHNIIKVFTFLTSLSIAFRNKFKSNTTTIMQV